MGMLRPWLPALVIVTLVATAKLYDGVTGGSWLDLFFEPPVKPPVWAPFKPEQVRSDDPEFLRGVAAYDRQDLAEAYAIWLPLAKAGDAEAQYQVGWLLEHGWGVSEDDIKAAQWLELAGAKGHGPALAQLGYLHRKGQGVPKDDEIATTYYLRSMNAGSNLGTFNYGISLLYGKGVPLDKFRAFEIMIELSRKDYCRAHYILGDIYEYEIDVVPTNLRKAYWHLKKAEQGGCDAEAARTLLAWRLDAEIIRDVNREVMGK